PRPEKDAKTHITIRQILSPAALGGRSFYWGGVKIRLPAFRADQRAARMQRPVAGRRRTFDPARHQRLFHFLARPTHSLVVHYHSRGTTYVGVLESAPTSNGKLWRGSFTQANFPATTAAATERGAPGGPPGADTLQCPT